MDQTNARTRVFNSQTVITRDDTQEDRTPPRLPGDYTIQRELGHGGMGVVYLARQQSLGRDVAIKVLRPSQQRFRNLVDRFLHEAMHLAKLRHPHIVAIHEIGDAGGEPYFTMDYVDGEPLALRLSRGPLSPTQAVEPLTARRPSWFSIAVRWCRRHWKLAATADLAATLAILIAAPLFDQSYADLVAWGDEELATGNADVAARIYSRAWAKGTESEQRQLIDRIVQMVRLSNHPAQTLELALKVVALDPVVSFGERDFLIAQALVSRERAAAPSGAIDIWHARPSASLELVRQRLDLALQHGVPKDRRMEAEETLAAVKLVLAEGQPDLRYAPDFLYHLPKGSVEELSATVNNGAQALWTRGKAAMAMGRQLEADGNAAQAIAAYELALEFFRKVYPYYSGVSSHLGASLPTGSDLSGEECQLVADLCHDLSRLAPEKHSQPTGGIVLALDGVPLPADVVMGVRLVLCDVNVADPDENLPHQLPRITRLGPDGRAFVGVLDGRYRLSFGGDQARWTQESGHFMGLKQIDTDHWPTEVTIRGNRIEPPPARIRLADEVQLLSPKNDAILRLDDAEFHWQSVPQAAYYQVRFLYSTESPHSTTTVFAFIAPRRRNFA